MEIVEPKKGVRNANILWIILGIFLFPTLDSLAGLMAGVLKILGLSIVSRAIFSVSFEGLIIVGLLYVLFWIIRHGSNDRENSFGDLTSRDFKIYGFILLLIIVAGRTVSFFDLKNLPDEVEQMESGYSLDLINQITYLGFASTIMSSFRQIILFVIFFVIVFKNKD